MTSTTHLVLIPSYNTGPALLPAVRDACRAWSPVWVVIDGGADDGCAALARMALEIGAELEIFRLPRNGGKGAAVLAGVRAALARGYTHALVMDADGQHPADRIADFMAASHANPRALILGLPVFGPDAPWPRVLGHKLCNGLVRLEVGGSRIGDSLFGFRVYPMAGLDAVMTEAGGRSMRGFDFDPEAAVRLCWRGLPTINLPARVRYFSAAQHGVSHFHYLRDNLLLGWMHARLMLTALFKRWTPKPSLDRQRE